MKARGSLRNICVKALAESMDSDRMIGLVQEIVPHYDIYRQTGFPRNMAIPNRDIARQIVNDMSEHGFFPPFILQLIHYHRHGYYGRPCTISYIDKIIQEMRVHGLLYDPKSHLFVEDPAISCTRNWGVFVENQEGVFTLLKLDIVGNTVLVKENSKEVVEKTYAAFRSQVFDNIERRNGRVWNWEGDGGIGAFFFGNSQISALMCAINILHEIFHFNHFLSELAKPLEVRLALHEGRLAYSNEEKKLFKNETVKQVITVESKQTLPNTISISDAATRSFDTVIKDMLEPFRGSDNKRYFRYSVEWEE